MNGYVTRACVVFLHLIVWFGVFVCIAFPCAGPGPVEGTPSYSFSFSCGGIFQAHPQICTDTPIHLKASVYVAGAPVCLCQACKVRAHASKGGRVARFPFPPSGSVLR